MGLFNMIGDVVGTYHDMKSLGNIQDDINNAIESLIKSGKCPEQLQSALEMTKHSVEGESQDEMIKKMMSFATTLNEHKDLLPNDVKEKAEKYLKVVEDLKDKVTDLEKLTGKK